jgi:hypothetical protein
MYYSYKSATQRLLLALLTLAPLTGAGCITTPYVRAAGLLNLVVVPVPNSNVAIVNVVSALATEGVERIVLPFSFGDDIYEVDPETDDAV